MTQSAFTVLSAESDEETSDGLDGQDASCPLSVDSEAVPGGEQAPTQGRPPHAALPLTCPLCERETSQTVFINKTTGRLVCPPCKVHGELVRLGGPSAWSCCIYTHARTYACMCVSICVCVDVCKCNVERIKLRIM